MTVPVPGRLAPNGISSPGSQMVGGLDTGSYVRVGTHRAAALVETVDVPGGLMFIDVAGSHAGGWHGAVAGQLRSVDEFVLAGFGSLIRTRSPCPTLPARPR